MTRGSLHREMIRDISREIEKVRKEKGDEAAKAYERKMTRKILRPFGSTLLHFMWMIFHP